MVKIRRKFAFTLLSLILFLSLISIVSAAESANFSLVGNSNRFIDLKSNNTINLTVGAINGNITKVNFVFTGMQSYDPEVFINGSNGTSSSSNSSFSISTEIGGGNSVTFNITFENTTSATLISNGSTANFWFTLTGRRMPSGFLVMNVNGSNSSLGANSSTFQFSQSFGFTGYILNETGCSSCFQNGTNVSIYGMSGGFNSPPSATLLASAKSNASGYFSLSQINSSSSFFGFRLKTVYYNNSNDSAVAIKTGTTLPDFPAMMFYGGGMSGEFDMSLNGGTFYLQPATTLSLKATNGTTQVSFGYVVIDQALGFPIESSALAKNYNVNITVPSNRAYAISFFRMFSFAGSSFGYVSNSTFCQTTDLMNDTICPTPPKSYSVSASSATQGALITINQSLIVRKAQVAGCINIASGANNSAINITKVGVKLLPWTTDGGSFVPSFNADDGGINITSNINYTNTECTYAFYNFSLLNNTGYMIEFYAKNASSEAGNPGGAFNLASFRNLTALDNNIRINSTLYRLAGSYSNDSIPGVSTNTSFIKINVVGTNGTVITSNLNVNLKVKNTAAGTGTVYYIIDNIANGTLYIPVLNNSNFAKVMVFSQNGPPRESSLNLSSNEINITVASMDSEKGFRRFKSNGTTEALNTTSLPIQIRFLTRGGECDNPNAPASCVITSMNASSFNPMKAMVAGKVNMEIKVTSTNVSLIFKDYDMMSAKQPPMQSILDQNATGRTTSGSSVSDIWNFGSFAPSDSYTNVTVVIPYSDSTSSSSYLNDSAPVNVSIPALYDENSNAVWNRTRGDITANLTDDFIEYNNTFFQGLVNSTAGLVANESNTSSVVFINTSDNYIAIKIPHFSTIGAAIAGSGYTAPAGSSTPSTDSPGSSGSSTNTTNTTTTQPFWTNTYSYNDKNLDEKGTLSITLRATERATIKIQGITHAVGIIRLTSSLATINVSSTSQQADFTIGQSKKFDVTDDYYYDLLITLNSINSSKANITLSALHEKYTPTVQQSNSLNNSDTNSSANETAPSTTSKKITKKTLVTVAIIVIILAILIATAYWFIYFSPYSSLKNRVKVRSP